MPIYIFQHPTSKEIIEIPQSIKEEHIYIDKDGVSWERIFTAPQLNTQDKLNEASSSKDFARVTSSQRGNFGDLMDRSKELSEKRKKIYGEDPIKKKYYSDWSKKRRNRIHPNSRSD